MQHMTMMGVEMDNHNIPRWVLSAYFREHPTQTIDERILQRLPEGTEPLGTEHQEWVRARGPIMHPGTVALLPAHAAYIASAVLIKNLWFLLLVAPLFTIQFAAIVFGDVIYHAVAWRLSKRWLRAQWREHTYEDFEAIDVGIVDRYLKKLGIDTTRGDARERQRAADLFYYVRDIAKLLNIDPTIIRIRDCIDSTDTL